MSLLTLSCNFFTFVDHRVNRREHRAAVMFRFTAPVDVAKDAILVAEKTLSAEQPSFEIG